MLFNYYHPAKTNRKHPCSEKFAFSGIRYPVITISLFSYAECPMFEHHYAIILTNHNQLDLFDFNQAKHALKHNTNCLERNPWLAETIKPIINITNSSCKYKKTI